MIVLWCMVARSTMYSNEVSDFGHSGTRAGSQWNVG